MHHSCLRMKLAMHYGNRHIFTHGCKFIPRKADVSPQWMNGGVFCCLRGKNNVAPNKYSSARTAALTRSPTPTQPNTPLPSPSWLLVYSQLTPFIPPFLKKKKRVLGTLWRSPVLYPFLIILLIQGCVADNTPTQLQYTPMRLSPLESTLKRFPTPLPENSRW